MIDLNKLEKTWFFKKVILKPKELLFSEWEKDQNLYIIKYWELYVEKFTNKEKKEVKILATLKQNEIFWEASLNNNLPKQTSIRAKTKVELLKINANKDFEDFWKKYREEYSNILKYIIFLSNKRLNESNALITASYKISTEIIKINNFNNKSIFELIEKIKDTIWVNKILYLEKNPVLDNYITLKYDTDFPWKMLDKTIEIIDNKLDLLSLKINWNYYLQNLNIWNKNYWYLIFIKKENAFSDNEIKIITTISTSLSWVLKQKELLEEQKNKEYIKNSW